jgi:hypothetical protein
MNQSILPRWWIFWIQPIDSCEYPGNSIGFNRGSAEANLETSGTEENDKRVSPEDARTWKWKFGYAMHSLRKQHEEIRRLSAVYVRFKNQGSEKSLWSVKLKMALMKRNKLMISIKAEVIQMIHGSKPFDMILTGNCICFPGPFTYFLKPFNAWRRFDFGRDFVKILET